MERAREGRMEEKTNERKLARNEKKTNSRFPGKKLTFVQPFIEEVLII
jgi:hypothetical protein